MTLKYSRYMSEALLFLLGISWHSHSVTNQVSGWKLNTNLKDLGCNQHSSIDSCSSANSPTEIRIQTLTSLVPKRPGQEPELWRVPQFVLSLNIIMAIESMKTLKTRCKAQIKRRMGIPF
jgi:hypothetical protein